MQLDNPPQSEGVLKFVYAYQMLKERRENSYSSFVDAAFNFITTECDSELLERYIREIIVVKVLNHFGRSDVDPAVVMKVLQTLQAAEDTCIVIPPAASTFPLLFSASMASIDTGIEAKAKKLFGLFFSNTGFADDFVKSEGATHCARIFVAQRDADFGDWLIDEVQNKITAFTAEVPVSFFEYFGKIREETITKERAIIKLVTLFWWVYAHSQRQGRKIGARAEKTKAFLKYCMLARKLPPRRFQDFLSCVLCTDDDVTGSHPNLAFVMAMRELCETCMDEPEKKHEVLMCVYSLLKMHVKGDSQVIINMDKFFPVAFWYRDQRLPVDEQIRFMKQWSDVLRYEVPQVLVCIIKNMKESEPLQDDSLYMDCLAVIFDELAKKRLDENALYECSFLNSFLQLPPLSALAGMLCNPETDIGVVCHIYEKIPQDDGPAESLSNEIFRRILDMCPYCPSTPVFFKVSVEFFLCNSSKQKMRDLLDWVTRSGQVSCGCDLLRSSFLTNVKVAQRFVKCNGIQWMDNLLNSKVLSLDLCADLISHLVILRRFDEIDTYVSKLSKDHPLFALSTTELDSIAYGRNRDRYRPIRICSLLKFIGLPKYIDPYNAWILGNFAVSQFLEGGSSIFDIPMLKEVANRFLLPEHADLLMERPYELEQYCDTHFDHFPLFQFFQSQESTEIREKFKTISFWVKFSSRVEIPITIFRSAGVEIKVGKFDDTQESIRLLVDGTAVRVPVRADLEKWNHIYLTQNDSWFKSTVQICVNNGKHIEEPRKTKGQFETASFGSIAPCLMFFAPAIRLSQGDLDPVMIFQRGPGCMDRLQPDEIVVLPYAFASPFNTSPMSAKSRKKIQLKVPKSCVGVPYFGIPFHFMSSRRMYYLFRILREAPSEAEFRALFRALLKINSVTVKNSRKFWAKLLNVCKLKPDYVSAELFNMAFKEICTVGRSATMRTKDVFSLITDPELWKSVDNRWLVADILDSYEKESRGQEKSMASKLQLFLAKVVLTNPEDGELILGILGLKNQVNSWLNYLKIMLVDKHETVDIGDREHRNNSVLRLTILKAMRRFVTQPDGAKLLKEILPFRDAATLLTDSSDKIRVAALRLILEIAKNCDYLRIHTKFLLDISRLSKYPRVWDSVRSYTIRDSVWGSGSEKIYEKDGLAMILVLIWAVTVCVIHSHSFCRRDLTNVNPAHDVYGTAIDFCRRHVPEIMSCGVCREIITEWFPVAVMSAIRLQEIVDHGLGCRQEPGDIASLFRGPDVLLECAGNVLTDYSFPIPATSPFGANVLYEWISGSQFCQLLCDFLCASGEDFKRMAPPLMIYNSYDAQSIPMGKSSIFYKDGSTGISQGLQFCTPAIVHSFFERCPVDDESVIRCFVLYLQYLVRIGCFDSDGLVLVKDLVKFASRLSKVPWAGNLIDDIMYILTNLCLFGGKEISQYMQGSEELKQISIPSSSGIKACLQAVSTLKIDYERLQMDLVWKKAAQFRDNQYKEACRLLSKVQREDQSQKDRIGKEVNAVRATMARIDSEIVQEARKLLQSLHDLANSSVDAQELALWKLEIQKHHEKATELRDFSPKSTKLSGRCLPFSQELVLRPSQYATPSEAEQEFKTYLEDIQRFALRQLKDKIKIEHFETVFGEILLVRNCRLIRADIDIPCILFWYESCFRLLVNAKFVESNYIQFLSIPSCPSFGSFIEAVFAGEFNLTESFYGHTVLVFKSSHHIHVREYEPNGIELWNLSHGHLLIEFETPSNPPYLTLFVPWNQRTDDPSTIPKLWADRKKKDIVEDWSAGKLSNTELCLWWNAESSRSSADIHHLPRLPDMFSSSSECFIVSNNPLTEFINYWKILDKKDVMSAFVASEFKSQDGLPPRREFSSKSVADLNIRHVFQKLRAKLKPNQTLGFNGKDLLHVGKLSAQLNTNPPILVKVSKKRQSIIFREKTQKGLNLFTEFDALLVFASSIAVSSNARFVVVDFVFGLTRVYLIQYEQRRPKQLELMSEFNWFAKPRSTISGTFLVVATARRRFLVLWSAITGHIHHKIPIDSPIVSIAMDESFGVWVVTEQSISFVSINGKVVARRNLEGVRITALTAVQIRDHMPDRGAICGTENGKLYCLCPCIENELIDARELPSQHKAGIRSIVVNQSLSAFMSIDYQQEVFLWTGVNCRPCENLHLKYFDAKQCPLCGERMPMAFCSLCGRLCCPNCLFGKKNICGVCCGIENAL